MFTPEELAELQRVDAEIERTFQITRKEIKASNRIDEWAIMNGIHEASERKAVIKRIRDRGTASARRVRRMQNPEYRKRMTEYWTAYNNTHKDRNKLTRDEWYAENKETVCAKQRARQHGRKEKDKQ